MKYLLIVEYYDGDIQGYEYGSRNQALFMMKTFSNPEIVTKQTLLYKEEDDVVWRPVIINEEVQG